MKPVQRMLILTCIVIGILLIGFFGLRAARVYQRIHQGGFGPRNPAPASKSDVELIRNWMTVSYIAKTYGVPSRLLFNVLGIPEEGNRDKSLEELNFEYYPDSSGFVLETIRTVLLGYQPAAPPTSTAPPAP